jgi:predicted nucleic acid-binding protein
MVKALFDTNVLIDYLNGIDAARKELGRYEYKAISVISLMEVLVGATPDNDVTLRAWLNTFEVIALDVSVANRALEIRRQHRIKLPDAIVWASAQVNSLLLVSRNTKDFPVDEPGVRVPYQV